MILCLKIIIFVTGTALQEWKWSYSNSTSTALSVLLEFIGNCWCHSSPESLFWWCGHGPDTEYPTGNQVEEVHAYFAVVLFRFSMPIFPPQKGVTKRCRLPWLTNSAIVYEPKYGGMGGGGGEHTMIYAVNFEPKIKFGEHKKNI